MSVLRILLYSFFTNQINFYLDKLTKTPKLPTAFFVFISGLWGCFVNGLSPLWSKYK
ncbi:MULTISPECIES: hypothetical protein [Clostridium]|uniref:hypothetical protein n=1 Tax=Clostridium TaxID=1485 RepID=UPI001A9BBD50|nr:MULTISPECIES: hypothetical protein [Clostridium]